MAATFERLKLQDMFHSAEANGWELYCKLNLAYVLYKPSSIKTEFAILFGIKIPMGKESKPNAIR